MLRALPELAGIGTLQIKKAVVGSFGVQLISREKQRFQKAILEANGDRTQAARLLGLSRATFFRKLKELGLVQTRRQRSLDIEGSKAIN